MAAIAAGLEMDPLFLKALTLLRSQRHESVKELGELVQEYREKISGSPLTGTKKSDGNGGKSPHIDIRVDSRNPKYNKQLQQLKDKMNEPSGSITLLKKLEEITNSNDDNSNQIAKSITQIEESIEEIIVGSSLEDKRKKQRAISDVGNFSQDAAGFSPESDIDLNDSISIDDIIEMDFDGPMCKVCQLNKRSEEENSLVECSECRSYYHQKCHRPEVSTKDLNDPRLIWYCSKCTKKMKKEMAAQQSSSSTLKTDNEVAPAPKLSNPFQQTKTFRRNLTTVTTISSDSTSNSENVARESTPSPVSNKRPRDATANSMKRLEQVKKRAKLQQQLKRK